MLGALHLNVALVGVRNALCRRASSWTEEAAVALSNDGRTLVCWHPATPFPYACSLPLPDAPIADDSSVLKVQTTEALRGIRRPKTAELQRQELMRATYTTKHVWFPCSRRVKHKKTPMDRPYL